MGYDRAVADYREAISANHLMGSIDTATDENLSAYYDALVSLMAEGHYALASHTNRVAIELLDRGRRA